MAVVMTASLFAGETPAPVTFWSKTKNAIANNKLVTGLVAGSAVVGGSVAAYMKSSRVQGLVSAGKVKAIQGGKLAVQFGKNQYAAMPGYLASAKAFVFAHPYVFGTLTACAVGGGLYWMYNKYAAKQVLANELQDAEITTKNSRKTVKQMECPFMTQGFCLMFDSGIPGKPMYVGLETPLYGAYIDLDNPIENSGRIVIDMNGKHFISHEAYNKLIKQGPAVKHLLDHGKPLVVASKEPVVKK